MIGHYNSYFGGTSECPQHLAAVLCQRAGLESTVLFSLIRSQLRTLPFALMANFSSLCAERETSMQAQVQLRFYSVQQMAIALNCSVSSVRDLIRRGFFQPSRALRHLRIPVEQVDAFVKTTSEL
ncbi:MAG: helix-turn-helix domain-containing protein, partial [Verrucomicrobiia bacterium]